MTDTIDPRAIHYAGRINTIAAYYEARPDALTSRNVDCLQKMRNGITSTVIRKDLPLLDEKSKKLVWETRVRLNQVLKLKQRAKEDGELEDPQDKATRFLKPEIGDQK